MENLRRYHMEQWTTAEKAIQTAVDEVEKVGADPALTDIVVMLGNAREKLADYIEKIPNNGFNSTPPNGAAS